MTKNVLIFIFNFDSQVIFLFADWLIDWLIVFLPLNIVFQYTTLLLNVKLTSNWKTNEVFGNNSNYMQMETTCDYVVCKLVKQLYISHCTV